jgi:quercetin dioxygenase-like cupin family protein
MSPELLREFVFSCGRKPRSYPTCNTFGDLNTPIITGRETAGGLVIFESIIQPNGGPPRHVHHREDEAFYVVEGKFLYECGDKRAEGGPGTYVFLPRDIPHCFQNIGDRAGKMVVICQPAGLESFFEEISAIKGPPDPAKVVPIGQKWGLELLGPPMAAR